jgi:hypothetical protein
MHTSRVTRNTISEFIQQKEQNTLFQRRNRILEIKPTLQKTYILLLSTNWVRNAFGPEKYLASFGIIVLEIHKVTQAGVHVKCPLFFVWFVLKFSCFGSFSENFNIRNVNKTSSSVLIFLHETKRADRHSKLNTYILCKYSLRTKILKLEASYPF